MKKFFLFLLTALCLACIGVAAACSGDNGDYCTLVFRQTNGVTYNCDIPSGVEVRTGTEVKFSITLSDEAQGIPVVYKNDEVIVAGEEDIYSFEIRENTVIKVLGVDAPGDEYNRIICSTPGADVKFKNTSGDKTLQNGMLVKNGTTVEFEVVPKEPYYIHEGKSIVVKVNGAQLTPGENNIYSFVMNGPAEITVENIVKKVNVTFVNGDTRVFYLDKNNGDNEFNSDEELEYETGDELVFKVRISSYYKQEGEEGYEDYEVQANSDILSRESDGYYHYTIKDVTKISVRNLILAESFTERDNCGDGSPENPFKLSRPIDLYQLAGIINNGWTQEDTFREGYYVLENDIDLQHEQLFIIGNAQNNLAYFAGHFDGKGHKISNFRIRDDFVEQENFQKMLATNVGMFGVVTPHGDSSPVIQNLTLGNYMIYANASQYTTASQLAVGSFVGMGYGVSIINCKAVNGEMNVTGGSAAAYVGGIIGQQVSAYSDTGDIAEEARVISCQSDVEISVPTGVQAQVYASGGITGLLGVGERSVSAYVLNSCFTGNIMGGLNAGGIVGYASDFTSVENCYSKANVWAYSPFSSTGYVDVVYNSNAGGIVGELGYDAIVYGCFSDSDVSATSARAGAICKTGPIVAVISENETDYGFNKSVVQNSYFIGAGDEEGRVDKIDQTFISDTLMWDVGEDGDWILLEGNDYPVVNGEKINQDGIKQREITLKFTADGNFGTVNDRKSNGYKSLAEWGRLTDNNAIPEYLQGTESGASYRSYGYFFDEAKTKRVPLGFVPTGDITLYIGSANYGEISGKYYLGDSSEDRAWLQLNSDGTAFYRNVNVSYESYYVYDGSNIVLYDSILGELTKVLDDVDIRLQAQYFSYYYNFGATVADGVISIVGGNVTPLTIDESGNIVADSSSDTFMLFPQESQLKGLKETENFSYGEYYSSDKNTVYGFNPNGSGYKTVKGDSAVTTPFTFTIGDGTVTIKYDNSGSETATVENGKITKVGETSVSPYDGFTGKWEAAYGIASEYVFDGTGKWTSGDNSNGDYTIGDGGVLTASNGGDFTAKINEDGFLEVTKDGKTSVYYREGSLKGEWYFSADMVSVSLTLNGIGTEGYGSATAKYSYGNNNQVYELSYKTLTSETGNPAIELYGNDVYFGTLEYKKYEVEGTPAPTVTEQYYLSGDFMGRNARFTVSDIIVGTWITNNDTLKTLVFNGNGLYDMKGENGFIAVKGSVNIGGKRVPYTLDRKTMTGEFTLGDVKYTIKYDEYGEITVTPASGEAIKLISRDKWYTIQLVDDAGNLYTFDGGGNLDGGGTIEVYSNGESDAPTEQGTYKITSGATSDIADQTLNITFEQYSTGGGGNFTGTIKKEDKDGHKVFVLSLSDSTNARQSNIETKLYEKTPFVGEWHIGTVRGTLDISQVYADHKATVSYIYDGKEEKVENVEATYYPDGGYLSFSEGDKTYYINALDQNDGEYKLSFGPYEDFSNPNNYTCIPKDDVDEYVDDVYYIYDAATGTDIGQFVFDGLGKSTGNVTEYGLKEGGGIDFGNVKNRYTYKITEFGYGDKAYKYPTVLYWFYEYLLIPCDKEAKPEDFGTLLYMLHDENSEHYFAVVRPDGLYNLKVKSATAQGTMYFFDGVGHVTEYTTDGVSVKLYEYEIKETDAETGIHKLEFKDEDGTVHNVTLNQSANNSEDWTISIDS